MECQKQVDRLNATLNERTDSLNRCAFDLDNAMTKNDKLLDDNSKLFSEIDRLKNHIILLTEQNQKVIVYV